MLEPDPKIQAHVQAFRTEKKMEKIEQKFSPDMQEKYLKLRRIGQGHYKACRNLGVTPLVVKRFREILPTFDELVRDAELEYLEKVEDILYEKALEGKELGALKEVLTKRNKERWGDDKTLNVNVAGRVEIEAGPAMERVASLTARLQQRAIELQGTPELAPIDAEIVDE